MNQSARRVSRRKKTAQTSSGARARIRDLLICLLLALVTLAAYAQVLGSGFVFDDHEYIVGNPHIQRGLTTETVAWAFTSSRESNWHPLTWLSHTVDHQLHGLDPTGHHVTNVLIHLATTLLLFLFLRQMTAGTWRSAAVAGLFALHPTHVESVAWISERKDVLSAFFWVLTMGAYARYAHRPSQARYLWTILAYALGLLTKQMAVTLPFVLLLLDYWPLGRLRLRGGPAGEAAESRASKTRPTAPPAPLPKLLVEKLPLLALALAASVATFVAQSRGGSVASLDYIPFVLRAKNALVSYVAYIGKMFWPADLSVVYPYRDVIPLWQAGAALLLIAVVTAWALRAGRRRPYAAVGWLWYLGSLIPVIGLVQIGQQSMADRYTYIPFIGLFILVCWLVPDLLAGRRVPTRVLAAATSVILLVMAAATYVQVGYWRDGVTLFERTIALTSNNYLAHGALGREFVARGRIDEGVSQFRQAVNIQPGYSVAHSNLGTALLSLGRIEEAIEHHRTAVRLNTEDPINRFNLASALAADGRFGEAEVLFTELLEADQGNVPALVAHGRVLAAQGRTDEARARYEQALELDPASATARMHLAHLLSRQGRIDDAIRHLAALIEIEPGNVVALAGYGTLLVGRQQFAEAVPTLTRALQLSPGMPDAEVSLGHALLAQGAVEPAHLHYTRAVELRPSPDVEYIGYGNNLAQQAYFGYGHTLAALGRALDATRGYEAALRVSPGWPVATTALAWLLATTNDDALRNADRALALAGEACRATANRDPKALDALAAAHADRGRFDEAIRYARMGIEAAQAMGRVGLVQSIEKRIEGYTRQRPYREQAVKLDE